MDGTVVGIIRSNGSVIIGETGIVNGTVEAKQLQLAGTINGDVVISELLQIAPGGYLLGNIDTGELLLERGAAFDGNCKTRINARALSAAAELPVPVEPAAQPAR